MKEFSQEIINIGGEDYTLFLNRKGIIAWENITKASRVSDNFEQTLQGVSIQNEIEIKDGDNPFEISSVDKVLAASEKTQEYYKKLYWIMLYTNHKLDYKDVVSLFDKAVEEYGLEQLVDLALQMVEDANINRVGQAEIKKLPALRPKKN